MAGPTDTQPVLVATCGLTTLDLIQYVPDFPGPDQKVQAESAGLEFGGPAANAAATAVSLGIRGRLVSPVGSSRISSVVRQMIAAAGVELCDVPGGEHWELPVSSVVVDRTGARTVVSMNAHTSITGSVPDDALQDVRALLVDGHHLELCLAVARAAREAGVPVLLDGGSWKPGLERLIEVIDAAVVSADFRLPQPEPVLESDLWGDRPVAVTRGGAPVLYRVGGHRGEVPVQAVDAVDTTGAGDVFHGAWLTFVGRHGLQYEQFADALEFAARIASLSCVRQGLR